MNKIIDIRSVASGLLVGLLIVFLVAVLGCGTGLLPSATMMHSGIESCSSLLVDVFMVVKEEGVMVLVLLAGIIASALVKMVIKVGGNGMKLIAGVVMNWREAKNVSAEAKIYDIVLQILSAGILQPKLY